MYVAWLANLNADQKASIKHVHAGWSKVARAADAAIPDCGMGINQTQGEL
jgi:hypothetical protein